MALPKRSSPTQPQTGSTRDLKQRVITCLNKLSDRDTHAIATTELESIARNLSQESFTPFLNCIYDTDSSQKTPVRKQCVRLLGFLSETHGDALSPFCSKMLANIVRRLKDPDTAVRSACVDSVTVMASQIGKVPFSMFVKPLMEVILVEQDLNSQMGSALCLASAVEASVDPEPAQLQRLLPRLVKLLRSESFKPKPALLSLIGSIVGVGGASNQNVLGNLIPCMVEFLGSEDWVARKAAAEAFSRLAVVERDLLPEFKPSCIAAFETRKFDKIKVVRDTMNGMMEVWKDLPDLTQEVSPQSQSKSSIRGSMSDGQLPTGSRNSVSASSETPQAKTKMTSLSRSPPRDSSSVTSTARRRSSLGSDAKSRPALFRKLDNRKPSNWKVEIAVPESPCTSGREEDLNGRDERSVEAEKNDSSMWEKPETKRVIFNRNKDDRMQKLDTSKAGSRVFPVQEESPEVSVVVSNGTEEYYGNDKEPEDLSLIRKQLLQIENQQSSLFDLLQKFMGSSQTGIKSLETRVLGLEMALDGISHDLAMSGRMPNTNSERNTCCKLPGTEFLSSKFRRKPEGRYSTSKFSAPGGPPSLSDMYTMDDKDDGNEPFSAENRRFWHQGGGGFAVNPLADTYSSSRTSSEGNFNRTSRNMMHNMDGRRTHSDFQHGVVSHTTVTYPTNLVARSTA